MRPLWLSACVMQYALGPAGVTVTVVELPPLAQPADVCVTLPALEPLHTRLRIDEGRLIAATRGAFSLGRHYVDAGGQGAAVLSRAWLEWLTHRREGIPAALAARASPGSERRHSKNSR